MSITLMTVAWKADMPSGRKMVLLALCDNANDEGQCHPSIPTLMKKCSMGERTIHGHIGDLETDGVISRTMAAGKKTIYHIDPRKICAPAETAPPQKTAPTPADIAVVPPQILQPTPADSAGLLTISEPSSKPSVNQNKRVAPVFNPRSLPLPTGLSNEKWNAWIDYRRDRKLAMPEQTAKAQLAKLGLLIEAGYSADQIIDNSITNGWQGLFEPKQARASPKATSRHSGFENIDYHAGVSADGRF